MAFSRISAADLSAAEGKVAKFDAAGKAALATAASDALMGVIKDGGSASGDAVSIWAPGEIGRVIVGGNVDEGAYLTVDGSSLAIATTTDTNEIVGKAMEAGVANDEIQFLAMLGRFAG